jgi:hypothetical protein
LSDHLVCQNGIFALNGRIQRLIPAFQSAFFGYNPRIRQKKGAEVRRRGVKFNTSARGFVFIHTRPVNRSSFSGKKDLIIFKKYSWGQFLFQN